MSEREFPGGRILVVDDEPMNRELIRAYFSRLPCEVVVAASGTEALALAAERLPDLVLLDVMMPGLDGFETATRLKALAGSEFLPIILVTALGDHASRVKGFEAGADEYLQKPVNRLELHARVRNLLSLRRERQELAAQNARLRELQRLRDEMTSLVVHDLKSPLTAVSINLRFIAERVGAPGYEPDLQEAVADARLASGRLLRLISDLLDVARAEEQRLAARKAKLELGALADAVVRENAAYARERRIRLELAVPDGQVVADGALLQRMLENLLENAIRHAPAGARVAVRATLEPGRAEILVGNEGKPIPAEARARIFDKWGQAQAGDHAGGHRGLGLYFCRLAAEAHGGTIEAVDHPEFAACFQIVLPQEPAAIEDAARLAG